MEYKKYGISGYRGKSKIVENIIITIINNLILNNL